MYKKKLKNRYYKRQRVRLSVRDTVSFSNFLLSLSYVNIILSLPQEYS